MAEDISNEEDCLKGGRRCWEYVRRSNKGGCVASACLVCHLLKVKCETAGRMESVTSTCDFGVVYCAFHLVEKSFVDSGVLR